MINFGIMTPAEAQNWFENEMSKVGHKVKTQFYYDFSMQETLGKIAIADLYSSIFRKYHKNKNCMIEMMFVFDYKTIEHANAGNNELREFYEYMSGQMKMFCKESYGI